MRHHCWIGSIASLLTLLVLTQSTQAQYGYGYIRLSDASNETSVKVCSAYNDLFKPLSSQAALIPRRFVNNYPNESCSNATTTTSQYSGKIVFIKRGNCTFAQKALNLQNGNASGAIVVSESNYFPPSASQSEYDKINIFVFLIAKKSFDKLMDFQQNLTNSKNEEPLLWLHAGEKLSYDLSSPMLLLLAVVVCSAGAWWQKVRYMSLKSSGNQEGRSDGEDNKINDHDPQAGLNISVTHAVVYVICCSLTLLLMYKFYSYLVYIAIGTFFIGSTFALFNVLHAVSKRTKFFSSSRVPYCRIEACNNKHFSFCGFMLFLCAVAISSTWLIYRHSEYSWILLDLLGASFCMFGISMIRMPSFKISGTFLSLFFFYDIFYVFLTPYLTPSGDSIMVAVASGAGSATDEELPGMFKMPKFHVPECGASNPAMIGFGDILLPGLHLGFCAVWDSKITMTSSAKTNIYYITGVVAYAAGLFLTSVALVLMQMGQPALLYIVPCVLLTTLVVAWLRGEVKAIFRGFPDLTLEKKHEQREQLPSGESGEQNSLLSENFTDQI